MQKRAAAVLTPEAEQEAMQGMAPQPGGMPMQDPSMGGAPMPPEAGGMPGAPQGNGGGQLPPEILQDAQFIQWLAQQGVQFDPNSGMFMGPDGQPLPADAVMQAYQAYQQEMAAAQGGAPQGQPMPPDQAAAQGGMPSQEAAAAQGGQLPPEILNDQVFMQFMQEAMGTQFDPNSGMFMDGQSGQPIPPEMVMQAYQEFQTQMQATQGGAAPEDGAPAEGAAPAEGGQPAPEQGAVLPPEVMEQFQSIVDASIDNFTAQLDKKLEALMDKLETVKMALESLRDTDDQRSKQDKDALKQMQDDLAAELNPTTKTASIEQPRPVKPKAQTRPVNVFEFLARRK